jgi:methylenetetrahydrofolate reductase (NADPH)
MRFVDGASTEITPFEERRLPDLVNLLRPGTTVYVPHTPSATLDRVVRTTLAVQRSGFVATPHIVARRINYPHTLRTALAQLRAGGVEQIVLIAGDTAYTAGEFTSTLDILDSGIIEESGIARIGVAGYPEGHKAVSMTLLWGALKAKQSFAERTGIRVHIVTQFGFHANTLPDWEHELVRNGIRLPVHAGIAGPTPLPKLIQFAMLCGTGASLRTVMRKLSASSGIANLAISPDQHVMRLVQLPAATQVVAPHFFSFGGTLETARWIKRVGSGNFDIDVKAGKFRIED